MIELKNCPFCGGTAWIRVRDGVCIICMKCGAQTREIVGNFTDEEVYALQDVVYAWNKRDGDKTELEITASYV